MWRDQVCVDSESYSYMIGGDVFWCVFFFSSRRRHTRLVSDWSSDVCSSDLQRSRSPSPGQWYLSQPVRDLWCRSPRCGGPPRGSPATARRFCSSPSRWRQRKSGIPNRKKTRMHTRLSCKIDYLLRSNHRDRSIASEFFPDDLLYQFAECLTLQGFPNHSQNDSTWQTEGFAMGQAIAVRMDYTSDEVRQLAKRAKDASQARRLLAIAVVL